MGNIIVFFVKNANKLIVACKHYGKDDKRLLKVLL